MADYDEQRILEVAPGGAVTVLAGPANPTGGEHRPGFCRWDGSEAQFAYPSGVALDTNGNLYVADTWNNAIRKMTPVGTPSGTNWVVTTLAGSPPPDYYYLSESSLNANHFADGTGSAALFWQPSGVAVDEAGNVFVADTLNSAIRKVTPEGVVTTLAGSPTYYWDNGYFYFTANSGGADGIGGAPRSSICLRAWRWTARRMFLWRTLATA